MARLTVQVDSKGVKQTDTELKNLTKTGKKTEDQFKSFGKNASAAVASIDGPLGGISSRISSVTTLFTSGTAAVTLFAAAVTGGVLAIAQGVKELDKLNLELAKTEAILKATGNAAGFTGEQLQTQAQDIARATLASTEGIQQAQAILLTFNRVSNDVFTDAINLSQDLATVFGGTAASSATQLGKALQDPIKGITALNRVGVSFTDTQKEQIRLFVEGGETAKAQAIIIGALKDQVGGAGESVTGGLAGATDTLGQNWSEFVAALAEGTGAYDATIDFINRLASGIKNVTDDYNEAESAAVAFQQALDLKFDIAEAEQNLEGLTEGTTLYIQRLSEVNQLRAQEAELLEKAGKVAEKENEKRLKEGQAQKDSILTQQRLDRESAEESEKLANEKAALIAQREQESLDRQVASIQRRFETQEDALQRELELINQSTISQEEQAQLRGQLWATYTQTRLDQINEEKDAELAAQKEIQNQEERAQQQRDILANQRISALNSTTAALRDSLGEQNDLYKAAAITNTTIATYESATQAYKALAGIPIVGPGLGAAAAGVAVAAGLANVESIRSARMQGGQVNAGQAYNVGERGVETFVPTTSGRIIPNGQAESSQVKVVVNNNAPATRAVAEQRDNGDVYVTIEELPDLVSAIGANPDSDFNRTQDSLYRRERA
jgi:hypothetical protein